MLIAASASGRVASGPRAGHAVQRLGVAGEEEAPGRAARWEGYSLHATTTVAAERREELERLCRYLLPGPLAKGRLSVDGAGNVVWRLRRPWSDGTTGFVLTPLELVERLAARARREGHRVPSSDPVRVRLEVLEAFAGAEVGDTVVARPHAAARRAVSRSRKASAGS